MSVDEDIAIQLLKRKNVTGLEALVKKYQLPAIRAAYLIVRNRETAEDIVQQVFIRIFERIEQYDAKRPFSPWFFRIVVNDAVKSITREREAVPIDIFSEHEMDIKMSNVTIEFSNPEDTQQKNEIYEKMWEAIGDLSPEQRATFVMKYYFSLSLSEMSAQLKTPVSTLKWRLLAARKRLRQLLKSENE